MKEVLAIIQMNKMEITKDALDVIGIPSITAYKVFGRGKQRGLQIPYPSELEEPKKKGMQYTRIHSSYSLENSEFEESKKKNMKYIPKRMISIMVEDEFVPGVVAVITKVNRTGNIGDGRIFVCPIDEAVRIRTGERGNEAIS